MKNQQRAHKGSRVFLYCIMILILLTLLVSATYTWFAISRTPRVSDIGLYINAPTGLVLSTAPEGAEWVRRLDYAEMVACHEKSGAACTIAVRTVPLEEASRFGILNTNPDGSIYEFEEKPKQPKSRNASMGIYVFNWSVLREFLIADEEDETSSNDFGKNIIPNLLNAGHKLMAYNFDGYWKDVGTIDSLWEANMDLLGKNPEFDIRGDENSRIYARNDALPSSYIDAGAVTVNCFIAEGSEIYGTVRHSIISTGCTVGEGALVEDSVVMPGAVIESGAIVRHAILGENSRICRGSVVGGAYAPGEKKKISVTGKDSVLEQNTVLLPGELLG